MKLYIKTWKIFNKNILQLPIPLLADFLTLYSIIFVMNLFSRIIENPLSLLLLNIPNPQKSITPEIAKVILFFAIFYILVYFIFTLLQAISWRYAHRYCGEKISLLKSFMKINAVWLLFYILADSLHNIFQVLNRITGITVVNEIFLNYAYLISLIILFYFILISYSSKLSIKKTFILGIQKAKIFILSYFIIILTFVIINYFMALVNETINMILGVILLLPMLTWSRILFILTVKEVQK